MLILSRPTTLAPSASSARARLEPIKPAIPVIKTRAIRSLPVQHIRYHHSSISPYATECVPGFALCGLGFPGLSSYSATMPAPRTSVASRILKNSAWYGLEQVLEAVIFFGTSIAVARYLGPEKLGYYQYINFFVQVVTRTSGSGLAGATRKYMVEFLAQDKPGTAHAVYKLAYRFQVAGALLITALGLGAVAWLGQPGYRLMASLLILSIVPGILSWIPAMANLAFEDLSRNTLSALAYIFSYTTTLILTLHFHWGLVGIASALLLGRTVEVLLRTGPLHRRLAALPLDTLDSDVKLRIRRFCLEAARPAAADVRRLGSLRDDLPQALLRSGADRLLLGQL